VPFALLQGGVPADPITLAASTAPTEVLFGLFLLLLAAKLGEEGARRLGQPAVVGELLGGFLIGPFALGGLIGLPEPGETAAVFAEIGVVILLFAVGLEVRLDDLFAVGRPAVLTALIAMVLPIAAGFAIGVAINEPFGTSAFIGLALAATSIGITSRVLADMNVLDRAFSRVVLGAAVIDDVLALILIGIVSGLVEGDLSATTFVAAVAGVALVILGFAIARRARGVRREAFTWPLFADTPLVPAFLMMLAFSLLAVFVGLAAIIGAFVVGLMIAETPVREEVEHGFRPLLGIFAPFFFAVTGANIDMSALLDPELLVIVLVLAVMGVVTKLLGGIAGSFRLGKWNSIVVGVGMSPRGEVGIVVAALGLSLALIGTEIYAVLLAAVILTTLVAPFMLQWAIPRAHRDERHHGSEAGLGAA
jgi:Kef-type K+ transport system membrane component KefB